MATIAFDTLDYVKKLRSVGVSEEQAEIQAKAIASILASDQVVTKEYLDMRLAELKADLIKWVIAICAGQGALIVALMKLIK